MKRRSIRLDITTVFMVGVYKHVSVHQHVSAQDLGEDLFLIPRSYHVHMFAFVTMMKNLLLLFMAMLLPRDTCRAVIKSSSLVNIVAILGFCPSYDERGERTCFA